MTEETQPLDAGLLTTEQVMDILIADARLRSRAVTCVLAGVLVGGETRFRKHDLDAWINRQISFSLDRRNS